MTRHEPIASLFEKVAQVVYKYPNLRNYLPEYYINLMTDQLFAFTVKDIIGS